MSEKFETTIARTDPVEIARPVTMSMPELLARLQALPKPSQIELRDVEEIPERDGL